VTRRLRHVLVGGICFVLGALFSAHISMRYASARLDALARHIDALDDLDDNQAVFFDVWATSPRTLASPVYEVTLAVLAREGEAMAVGLKGESHLNFIVCAPHGAVNPCGPEGIKPDEYGAVVRGDAP